MHKGPIYAIIVSVIAVIGIYFFTDIKQKKEQNEATTEVSYSDENEQINSFNANLTEEEKSSVSALFERANNQQDENAADELIAFYESKQQYNFAAYYHTLKAEIANNSSTWELAGDRQLSVSSNDAYDPSFNQLLFDQSLISYQKSIDLDSTNLDLQVKLGSAIVDNSPQPMQGITLLLGVITKDSMHVNGNLALGKFGIISGQYDKAVIRLEKVLSSQPQNTEALFLAAEAYSELGDKEKAYSYLEKCKQLVENEELKKEIEAYMQQLL